MQEDILCQWCIITQNQVMSKPFPLDFLLGYWTLLTEKPTTIKYIPNPFLWFFCGEPKALIMLDTFSTSGIYLQPFINI